MTIENIMSKETKTVRDRFDLLLKKDLNSLVGKCFVNNYALGGNEDFHREWFSVEQIDDGAIVGTLVEFCDGDFSIHTGQDIHFGDDVESISRTEFIKALTRAQAMFDQKISSLKEE